MAALKKIRESKDTNLLSLCIVEGEETEFYRVTRSAYTEIGSPSVGEYISDDDLATLKYADRLYRAEMKALSILSFADNNKRSLVQKLMRAGFDREISEEICEKMVSLGYINEQRQLERLILIEANTKLRGPGRIMPALVSKGYNSTDVRAVLRRLVDLGEIDFEENARRLLEKNAPDGDREQAKKLLFKNGYKI